MFGQKLVVPRNGNLSFAQGLVEQFSGDQNLMSLRSRASFTRPLTVIQRMESRAQQQYLGKIKELEDSVNQTQEKLQALQKGKPGAGTSAILTAEQQTEIDNFRKKAAESRVVTCEGGRPSALCVLLGGTVGPVKAYNSNGLWLRRLRGMI